MPGTALTNLVVGGVPLTALIGAVLFTWYAHETYSSDLKAIEDRVDVRIAKIEQRLNTANADRFTRGDFYVWCIRVSKPGSCDAILYAPSFVITSGSWLTRIEAVEKR